MSAPCLSASVRIRLSHSSHGRALLRLAEAHPSELRQLLAEEGGERSRSDIHAPSAWRRDLDAPSFWVSPKGHRYTEERQVVQRVMKARVAMGLPPRPEPVRIDDQGRTA